MRDFEGLCSALTLDQLILRMSRRETPALRRAARLYRPGAASIWCFRTSRLPGLEAVSLDVPLCTKVPRRWWSSGPGQDQTAVVWALRLLPDRSMLAMQEMKLNEADRASVALWGSHDFQIIAEENPVLVLRWIVHLSQAAVGESNLIIRHHSALDLKHRIIDEFSPACLTIKVKRRLNLTDIIDALTDLFAIQVVPALHPFRAMARIYFRRWIKTASMWRLRITSLWHLGRTVIAKASMPVSGTKYRMERYSVP